MRKILLTTVFILTTAVLFAQNMQDVVHLTNGSIIRGTIVEQVPNQSITIETADGSLFVFAIDEVERMTREQVVREPVLQQTRFGIIGGLNFASQMVFDTYGTGSGSTNARTAFHIGAFMEMPMGINWTFRPELQYSMQGASSRMGGRTITDKFDYINLPLVFRWHFWQRRMSLDFGPQFGYLVSATVSDGRNIIDELNRFDASLVLGVSVRLNENVSLSTRGIAGATNIIEINGMRYTNSVSQLSLVIKL